MRWPSLARRHDRATLSQETSSEDKGSRARNKVFFCFGIACSADAPKVAVNGFLDRCRTMYGALGPSEQARLAEVLRDPSADTWDAAHGVIIAIENGHGPVTLLDAWQRVDPQAPRARPPNGDWPHIPDAFTLYRAIRAVTRFSPALSETHGSRNVW